MDEKKRRNRLEQETSPYLLQHASNPVDWFPWADEALAKAKRDQKPIFLSIGYSACHWCHVMERESFEDEETASILNEHFISIKVDREERPDIDHIYMTAVQAMTQHGGWPLTVFLTPELQPFYGGTYFPKEDKYGMPSFKKILAGVSQTWKTKPDDIRKSAEELTAAIVGMQVGTPTGEFAPLSATLFERAAEKIVESFDPEFGGLGNAPKFFHSTDFRFLLRAWKESKAPHLLAAVETTLSHWANGGIYDQLGGGFHRYSTDRIWLVPHFEKMLYDNALLVPLFLEAYQATKNPEWARIARETLDYLQREMEDEAGGFYATQDADSEGVEGKFFVWERDEIKSHLDEQLFEIFSRVFDLPVQGNWEDHIILKRLASLKEVAQALKLELSWVEDNLAVAKKKLLEIRSARIAPQTDHKIVTSWNGLALTAFARGYAVLGVESYRQSAEKCASLLLKKLGVYEGSQLVGLCHTYKDGFAKVPGFLEDYACLVDGLLSLFGVTWEIRWLEAANDLSAQMVKRFWDPSAGQFFYTSAEHTDILTRVRDSQDGATPSGTSMAFTALIRFAATTGVETYHPIIEKGLGPMTPFFQGHPTAVSQLLCAAYEWHAPHTQWISVCSKGKIEETKDRTNELIRGATMEFHPLLSRWVIEEGAASRMATKFPVLSKKTLSEAEVRHFVCKDFSCSEPTDDDELAAKEAGIGE